MRAAALSASSLAAMSGALVVSDPAALFSLPNLCTTVSSHLLERLRERHHRPSEPVAETLASFGRAFLPKDVSLILYETFVDGIGL